MKNITKLLIPAVAVFGLTAHADGNNKAPDADIKNLRALAKEQALVTTRKQIEIITERLLPDFEKCTTAVADDINIATNREELTDALEKHGACVIKL